ncbi:hypothetical protein ACIBG8_47255 [Nonomuraea sp. NPDC050556]|uniref:hypothetical protein n=1 Tax=Nonomuraea sp. NPDC050556 TaxID=3364369 RepID=UPI00379E6358
MSRLGPVITLAAGAILATGLGVASVATAPAARETTAAAVAEPTVEVTSAATPAPVKTVQKIKADYAGHVNGNGGLIAVSIRDGKAIGYFCDGKTEAWFKGTAADGAATLAGFGDAKLSASFGGGKAKGKLSLSGKSWTFTAPTVVKPSGLYRATQLIRGAQVKAGWIVLQRPDRNGFIRVGTAYVDGKQVETPELTPGQPVTLNGVQIQPKDVDAFIEEMQ